MATLEEVFLKINQEFAPELFGSVGSEEGTEEEVLKNSETSGQGNSSSFPKAIGYSMDTSKASSMRDSNGPSQQSEV